MIKGTFNILPVTKTKSYLFLSNITSDVTNWFTLGFFVLTLLLFLYHYHVIKKKTVEEYGELTGFLILGIITHLIMDVLIQETSPWI